MYRTDNKQILPRDLIKIDDEYFIFNNKKLLWEPIVIDQIMRNIKVMSSPNNLLFSNGYIFSSDINRIYKAKSISDYKDGYCISKLKNVEYISDNKYIMNVNDTLIKSLKNSYKEIDVLYQLFYEILYQMKPTKKYYVLDKVTFTILAYTFRDLYDTYVVDSTNQAYKVKRTIIPHNQGKFKVLFLKDKKTANILLKMSELNNKIVIIHRLYENDKQKIGISLDIDDFIEISIKKDIEVSLSNIGSIILSTLIHLTKM